jgi:hypothetical protein
MAAGEPNSARIVNQPGEVHTDRQTDDGGALPAVRDARDHLCGAIRALAKLIVLILDVAIRLGFSLVGYGSSSVAMPAA